MNMNNKSIKSMVNEAVIDSELRRENRTNKAKKNHVKIVAAVPQHATAMELAFKKALGK